MAATEEAKLKAFDTVLEWAKQLVTISAALLVLSTTFIRNVVPDLSTMSAQGLLATSWGILLGSVILGVCVMGTLAASLNDTKDVSSLDVFETPIRVMGLLQFLLFLAGIGLFMCFVNSNLP